MWSSLPSLQGVGAKRVVLIVAMCLSVLLNVVVVGVYMHGGHTSRATAAGARPNAMPEAAEETAAKLLKAEQRAELLLAELLDATNRSTGEDRGADAAAARLRAAAATAAVFEAARPAAEVPPGGVRWLLWLLSSLIFGVLHAYLLLAPGVLAVAFALASYLQLTAKPPLARRLKLAAGLSLPSLLLAERCGLPGASLVLWLYAGAAGATVGLGLALSEGWRRALSFWRLVGAMIVQYHMTKLWGRQQGVEAAALELRYEELHTRFAPRVLALILELRGFYVKLGQVLSVIEMVPEAYKRELAVLQQVAIALALPLTLTLPLPLPLPLAGRAAQAARRDHRDDRGRAGQEGARGLRLARRDAHRRRLHRAGASRHAARGRQGGRGQGAVPRGAQALRLRLHADRSGLLLLDTAGP